jgi:beta-ureidopropionase
MQGKDRAIYVAAVTQDYLERGSREGLVEETLERLERAACRGPDIVCLPETFSGDKPEPVPGPMIERLSRWARGKSCYLICSIATQVGDRKFNSAVLLDREGEVVGRYDKIHPTEGELEGGVCPGGPEPPVFRTDFGTIGIQICFDVNWREVWARLKEKGAEIVFWPSAFPADRHLAALAWQNEFYVVSATKTRPCRIYDISGEVLGQSGMFQPWADAQLHLGKRLFEIDYHTGVMREVERKYGRRVLIRWYHDEDWFTLASVDPELSVEELMAEFGLVPLRSYQARCERAIAEARAQYQGTAGSPDATRR